MIALDASLTPVRLLPKIERLWSVSAPKIRAIEAAFDTSEGAPVFTVEGQYQAQGWTEWTQGFQYGSAILQYDATDDEDFLKIGRTQTVRRMAPHVTHIGVHDHGFNNVSTYGALWRLMNEGRLPEQPWERHFYELALKCSGAVQASRWTALPDDEGYIYSFNGPQSLFSDTIRSLRALVLADRLGHVLMGEHDESISLLGRAVRHARATAFYNVYYGEGRDAYDVRGRVVHESIFNVNDGRYRCPSTQQGYSPLSTWTRGLAWILTGYAEQLEFFDTLDDDALEPFGGREDVVSMMEEAARAAADFYVAYTPTCGVPYWDTGAPHLDRIGDYLDEPADPYNAYEPVDSSAAAIAVQGLIRLGRYLDAREPGSGKEYRLAGLKALDTLLDEPYLSTDPDHQGLLLHAVYHRPRGWDHVREGQSIPNGESCMWGDYHLREAALYVERLARDEPYYTFFGPPEE